MNREQAINYLFSCGFTNEQVGDVVRALTYEPTTKNDLGVDCISREQALRELKESAKHHANDSREEMLLRRDRVIVRAQPTVEAIPKADYENRLKADLKAILEELQLEIDEEAFDMVNLAYIPNTDSANVILMDDLNKIIQQKINSLKEA